MKKLVVLTGSGISAESGLKTFRDANGLWEQYNVYEVATPEAWERDPELVLRFYNQRRKQLSKVHPNEGHLELARLEKHFDVHIITQNVDDLHERAGSSNILHLHGELKKSRSTSDPGLVYEVKGTELNKGDTCEKGSQLRPHVVWFGEPVSAILEARQIVGQADIFAVIGSSLIVYPAASLLRDVGHDIPVFLIDPNGFNGRVPYKIHVIAEKATRGVHRLSRELKEKFL